MSSSNAVLALRICLPDRDSCSVTMHPVIRKNACSGRIQSSLPLLLRTESGKDCRRTKDVCFMLRFNRSAFFFDRGLAMTALISSPKCYPVTIQIIFAIANNIADKKLKISQRPAYPATRRVELGHLPPHSRRPHPSPPYLSVLMRRGLGLPGRCYIISRLPGVGSMAGSN